MTGCRTRRPLRKAIARIPIHWAKTWAVASIVVLAGCNSVAEPGGSGAPPSPAATDIQASPTPSQLHTQVPRTSAAATASPSATPIAIAVADLPGPWQTVRARVNGLAVRSGPGSEYPLVAGYRWDNATNSEILETNSVRVDDGYYLWVEDGPIIIGNVAWYHVGNWSRQSTDEGPDRNLRWDADGDEFRSDYGWVAGADGSNAFLVAAEPVPDPPGTPVYGGAPDPYAFEHGIGTGRTQAFVPGAPVGIRWFAADPDGASCRITMTLQPLGIEMLSTEVAGWDGGDNWWPQDSAWEAQLPSGDYWIDIDTDCSWSLRVVQIIG